MSKYALIAGIILLSAATLADIPHVITFQGRLTDDLGVPLTGEYEIVFTIYDMPEGGNALWTSGAQGVGVEDGLFSYDLGMISPIPDSVFHQHFERWLGISVEGGPELMPRTIFNSVAFAYRAQFADNANWAEGAVQSDYSDHAVLAEEAVEAWHSMYADTADFAANTPGGGGVWIDAGTKIHLADTSDYVGIGTTNPTAELEIYSAGEPDLLLTRRSTAAAALIGFKTGTGVPDWSLYTPSGGDAFFIDKHDFENVFSCLQNGNVGVGTMTPVSRLTVDKGNILVRGAQEWGDPGDTAKLILGDPNHGLASIYGQGLRLWTFGDGSHSIEFGKHNGDNYMTIDGSGAVAINTSINTNEKFLVYKTSGPGQIAIHGMSGVSNPSLGGGVGVKGSFASDGVGGTGVYGSATSATPLGGLVGVYGYTNDPTSYAIYGEGGMAASGSISSIVATKSHGLRETYSVQSAGNWCEDFGSGSIIDGVARVNIDPVYSETVRMDRNYHVFLSPMGDCGLYVSEKHPDYFIVRAQNNRTCTVDFDYRIVAKRVGLEDKRLRSADKIAETMEHLHSGEK